MGEAQDIILHLGSNMGQRFDQLSRAVALIGENIGQVIQQSQYYETEAWGNTDQEDFINQAIVVRTSLSPARLIQTILQIEEQMGRIRTEKWGPRLIDIDILFYGQQLIDLPNLTLPHPRLHLRNFVLIPLLELIPDFIHPRFKKSVEELYLECRDESEVILLNENS